MRFMKVLFAFVLMMSLVAVAEEPAATTAPAMDGKASKATIYIYRYKQFVGSALEPSVYCDDVQLARMSNGRYFTVKVDAGKHTFHSNDKQSGIELDVKPGQEYFVRLEIATGFMKGHGRLILMTPEQAGYELKSDKLKPLDASKVANAAMVSTDEAHPGAASNQPQGAAAPKVQVSSAAQGTN
jgi:hypothetical protein